MTCVTIPRFLTKLTPLTERPDVIANQKKVYGWVIGSGILLLVVAGTGAYRAIRRLLSIVSTHQPFDLSLFDTVTSMAVLVTVCFAAAFIIALMSLLLMRREFERRRRTEDRLESVVQTAEQAGDLITILEVGGKIEYANHAVEAATGYSQTDLVGRKSDPWLPWYGEAGRLQEMRDAVLSGHAFRAIVTCRKKNGTEFFLEEHVTPLRDRTSKITRMLSTAREITEQKHLEDKLAYLDRHDRLTEAPNRREFVEQLDQAIAAAAQEKRFLSVLILDIDRFKYINDIFGYDMGDRVLLKVAALLRSVSGSNDLLARLGSD